MPDRLHRDPSLWFEARVNAVFGLIALLITTLVWLGVLGKIGDETQRITNLRDVEWWLWVVVSLLTLICLNFVMMITHKIRRAMTGRLPVVEVSRQPWKAGEAAHVRVADTDIASLDEWDVGLEARAVVSRPSAEGGDTYSVEVQHHARWLTLSRIDLGSEGRLERFLTVAVPHEVAGHPKWNWFIVVRGLIKKNGVLLDVHNDSYPVRVEAEPR